MLQLELIKEKIMEMVAEEGRQRLRPHQIEKAIREQMGGGPLPVKKALADLVHEQRLVYTYRDPCSFVEIPSA
jgi:hypothetical protein